MKKIRAGTKEISEDIQKKGKVYKTTLKNLDSTVSRCHRRIMTLAPCDGQHTYMEEQTSVSSSRALYTGPNALHQHTLFWFIFGSLWTVDLLYCGGILWSFVSRTNMWIYVDPVRCMPFSRSSLRLSGLFMLLLVSVITPSHLGGFRAR